MNQGDEIGGAVYEEILTRRTAISVSELARKLHVREEEKIRKALDKLCSIGVVAKTEDKYISADLVPPTQDIQRSQPSNAPLQLLADARASRSLVSSEEKQVTQYSVDTGELMKTEEAIQKILRVFTNPGDCMKAHIIAQQSGLGNSKGAVNRYLYFLAEQGFIKKNGKEWMMMKEATGEEMKVMAAQLAKKPGGKKRDSSTSLGSGEDCDCPNRGSACQHYHLTQNVHNHQYNIQVGDDNVINFGADGPRRSDT